MKKEKESTAIETTEAEKTKPEKTKPEKTKPEKTKPEETKPEETKPETLKEEILVEDSQKENVEKEKPKKNYTKWLILLLLLLFAAVIILIVQNKQESGHSLKMEKRQLEGQLSGKTLEEIQEELNRRVSENMFAISINNTPVFKNGKAEGNLRIENSQANHYYMMVKIVLNDTGEEVFSSGAIRPGSCLEKAKLDKKLKQGEYPATASFLAYDMESEEYVGEAAAELTIVIQN